MDTAQFVDSSALVKRYVHETGTAGARHHVPPVIDGYLDRAHHRRRSDGRHHLAPRREPSTAQASSLLSRYRTHLTARYLPSQITPAMISDAMTLANRHRLRAYDAVRLAAALDVYRDWSANRLARSSSFPPTKG